MLALLPAAAQTLKGEQIVYSNPCTPAPGYPCLPGTRIPGSGSDSIASHPVGYHILRPGCSSKVFESHLLVVLGRRILDRKPGFFQARHELGSQSPRARKEIKNISALFLAPKQTRHQSTNECRLNRQTCPRIQSVPTLKLLWETICGPSVCGMRLLDTGLRILGVS